MTNRIQTGKNLYLDFDHPDLESLPIESIARSLARECRFAGIPELYYSVAEHSIIMSYLCEPYDLAMEGLLHEIIEAAGLRDISSPLKQYLLKDSIPAIRQYEAKLAAMYSLKYPFPEILHKLDSDLYLQEACIYSEHPKIDLNGVKWGYIGMDARTAEQLFLDRYHELKYAQEQETSSSGNDRRTNFNISEL